MRKNFVALSFLFCFLGTFYLAEAQPSLEVYGQNRIQYRKFDWKFYNATNFKIYHYDRSGKELARFVAEQAERDLAAIEKSAGNLFPDKLSIILYNSFDDFDQTNIGLNSELQMQNNNPAGTVSIVGDKLTIYFTGNHADLKRQLRQGMSQVVMEHLMFGDNFKEIVRNAILLDLPKWVTAGYVDYIVDGWTPQDENDWKNIIFSNRKVYFNEIANEHPKLAGKAFWKYIGTKYGDNQVRNFLYNIQLKGSANKAAKVTLNEKLNTTFKSVIEFYKDKYTQEETLFSKIDSTTAFNYLAVPQDESEVRNIMVSPRGFDIAFTKWKHGEYEVIIEKTIEEKGASKKVQNVLLSGGVKNFNEHADPNYPLMAWSNTGFKLGIIYKNRNNIRIKVFNSVEGSMKEFKIPGRRFDRITGFSFMEDDDMIIVSAIKNGQSDLFELRLKGARLKQITDDAWDDRDPVFVSGGSRKGVVFLSNRPLPYINIKPLPNELPTGMMNAYFYSTTTKSYELLQLSRNLKGTISQVIPYGSDHFSYLSDKNGVKNRFVVLFARNAKNQDSAYSVPVTNYPRNILYQQYNAASGKVAEVIQLNKKYFIFFKKIDIPAADYDLQLANLPFIDGIVKPKLGAAIDSANTQEEKEYFNAGLAPQPNQDIEVKEGDYFQTEFSRNRTIINEDSAALLPDEDAKKLAKSLEIKRSSGLDTLKWDNSNENLIADLDQKQIEDRRTLYVDSSFISLRSKPYYLSFRPDFISLRLDNSVIFNRYQPYTNSGGQFQNPSLSGMLTVKLFDKMEDYRFTGGIMVPANFSGSTYFLQFENFRRWLDWGLIFLREDNKMNYNFSINSSLATIQVPGKTTSNIIQGSVSLPFDKVKGFHFYQGLRQDKMILKAQDPYGLVLPNVQEIWTMSRLEFVYDNTRNPAMNIWNGMRYKLYGEYLYKLYTDNDIYSLGDGNDFVKSGGFYNFGMDMRYYQKIYKNFIAAFRVAGAHSGGNQQIIYFLGGKENALNPKSETPLPPSGKNNYAFQSLAGNLRGYNQNARNGNTYALLNAELRMPIISTFFKRPVQSSILNNLQTTAFIDVGSAWEGLFPSEQNRTRNYILTWPPNLGSPPVSVQIPNNKSSGLALGYGLGLRTLLFGYFVAGDAAMNIEGDFRWYISFGTDF